MTPPASDAAPDVSVVVAVYNTMPYLRECLDSLVAQSIGQERLEVVTVDDGSTDGSGALLDEYAARHPHLFTVIHQENSGGPAGPSNRALDVAAGRYVYFLGADDHLGPEALERLVSFADEHDSDVVLGKVVGVHGRFIRQRLFSRTKPDVDLLGPDLRWSLANTNLFRRSLLEEHGIRYVEGLAFGSDQPFMLEACVRASRISVLGDYTCYYAVDRHDRSNISYSTGYQERARCIRFLLETVDRLVPAGAGRDTLLVRHFTWEVPSLLRLDLPAVPAADRAAVVEEVARFCDDFLTEGTWKDLNAEARVLLHLTRHDRVDDLLAMVTASAQPPVHRTDHGSYVGYPGFDPEQPHPAYLLPSERAERDRLAAGAELIDHRRRLTRLLRGRK